MDWGNALRNVYDGIVKAVSVGFSLMAIYLGFWGFFSKYKNFGEQKFVSLLASNFHGRIRGGGLF